MIEPSRAAARSSLLHIWHFLPQRIHLRTQLVDYLLEIFDDRYDRRSTLITSQLPLEQWHAYLEDPTLADAILDRLIHNSYRLALKGDSMRKQKTATTAKTTKGH